MQFLEDMGGRGQPETGRDRHARAQAAGAGQPARGGAGRFFLADAAVSTGEHGLLQ